MDTRTSEEAVDVAEPAFETTGHGRSNDSPVRAAHRDVAAADVTDTTQWVESLIDAMERATSGDWPTGAELRGLPPEDFARLARHLSLVIDRLNTLRIDLLGAGARRNARF